MGAKGGLSRREREIMDVLYERGTASVADVREALPGETSYSGVRALLRILETKGHIRHIEDGARYLYEPVEPAGKAAINALEQVRKVFFGGSVEKVVASLLTKDETPSDEELDRLEAMIKAAREKKGT